MECLREDLNMIQVKKTPRKKTSSDQMSAEELKARLQQHFFMNGTLNNLKTQLRNHLVTELFKVAELPAKTVENEFSDAEAKKPLLPLQVSNWLVYDHLKRQGYDYSLSTFVVEASVSFPEKLLSLKDVLDLLGIKSESEEAEAITKHYVLFKQGSFLHTLLSCVMKQYIVHHYSDLSCNKSTNNHENNVPSNNPNASVHSEQDFLNDTLTKEQHQLPNSKCLLDKSLNSGPEMFQQKFCQQMKTEQEKEIQRLSEKFWNEFNRIYEHEQQVHLELEQRKCRLSREQELLDLERSKLRAKEFELAKRLSVIERESEKMQFITEENLSSALKEKDEQLDALENKLKQQEQRLTEERKILNNQNSEIEDLKNQLQQYERNYHAVENKYSSLLAENAVLKGKAENAADSAHLKEELLNNLKEVEKCQLLIKEMKEKAEAEKEVLLSTVHNLQEQLKIYLQKSSDVKNIGVGTESSHLSDESVWKQQSERLEEELAEMKQLYHEVLQKLAEQNEDIQDLHLTVHVLHDEISRTVSQAKHATKAGGNDMYPPSTVSIPAPVIQPDHVRKTLSSHAHQSFNQPLNDARYPGLYYPSPSVPRTFKEDPYKLISEAKKRIDVLEQEAQVVKKKYSTFVATQTKQSHQGYFPYRSFQNYALANIPSEIYDDSHCKENAYQLVSRTQTSNDDRDPVFSVAKDPYTETTFHMNANEKHTRHLSFSDRDATGLPRSHVSSDSVTPSLDHHLQFMSREHPTSYNINRYEENVTSSVTDNQILSQSHKPDMYQGNEKSGLNSYLKITSSHRNPICYDNSVASRPPASQHAEHLHQNGEYQPVSFPTTTTNMGAVTSQNSKFADHPFHLSKFYLHNTTEKTVPSSSVAADMSHSFSPIRQSKNIAKDDDLNSEHRSQEYSKTSDASALNSKNSNLNFTSSVKGKNVLESSSKLEYSSREGEANSLTASQNVQSGIKLPLPTDEFQVKAFMSRETPEHDDHAQNSVLSEKGESDNDKNPSQNCDEAATYQTASLKSNKDADLDGNGKSLSAQSSSVTVDQSSKTFEDEKITGSKPKSDALLRRISVDLDSAWKQQAVSTTKHFMQSYSGSSYNLPSAINGAETAPTVKFNSKSDWKSDDISAKNVSSPRSYSFAETHLLTGIRKDKNNTADNDNGTNLNSNKDTEACQAVVSFENSHDSDSIKKSDTVGTGSVNGLHNSEKPMSSVSNLDSVGHIKHSTFHQPDEMEKSDLGHDDKQFASDTDHKNSGSPQSLVHSSQLDDDVKNVNTPLNNADDGESVTTIEAAIPDSSELDVGFFGNGVQHGKSPETGTEAEVLQTVPALDNIDRLQSVNRDSENGTCSTKDPVSEEKPHCESNNNDIEGAHDESLSELSELNLSAGNEELAQSKGEESDW